MRAYTVYTCTDLAGEVLYIGYTAKYRQRMYQHCYQSPWFGLVHRVERVDFPTMAEALNHESGLIRDILPPHNSQHVPIERRPSYGPWTLPHALIARVDEEARTYRITKSQALLNLIDRGLQPPAALVAPSPPAPASPPSLTDLARSLAAFALTDPEELSA